MSTLLGQNTLSGSRLHFGGPSIVRRDLCYCIDKFNPRSYYDAMRPNLEHTEFTDTLNQTNPRPFNQTPSDPTESDPMQSNPIQSNPDRFHLIHSATSLGAGGRGRSP